MRRECAATMFVKLQVFCVVTLCRLVNGHRRLRDGRSLAFRVKHSKKSEYKLDHEDESITILRNVRDYFPIDKANIPEYLNFSMLHTFM